MQPWNRGQNKCEKSRPFYSSLFYLNGPPAAVNLRAITYSESPFTTTFLGLGAGTVRGGGGQTEEAS